MATLQVTNLQNTAATVTNVSLLADGTTTLVLNSTGTSRTGGIRYVGGALEVYNGAAWVGVGGGGGGTVTGVTATAPLASTGGTAPVISAALATAAQAAAGTSATVLMTPQFAVPKDAANMTGAALLPTGTNLQRAAIATPVAGMTRFNTDYTPDSLEVYNGTNWRQVAYVPNPTLPADLTISANTTLTDSTYVVNNLTIAAGATATLSSQSVLFFCYGDVNIAGTIDASGKGPSGGFTTAGNSSTTTNTVGGNIGSAAQTPATPYQPLTSIVGSGGATGSSVTSGFTSGIWQRGGAAGGGIVVFSYKDVTISGSLLSSGGAGAITNLTPNYRGSGPGGGSGGSVIVHSVGSINFSGIIDVSGGAGANAVINGIPFAGMDGGGGGGGGYVILQADSTLTNTGTITLTGGAGGATVGASGNAGGGPGGSYGGQGGGSSSAGSVGIFTTSGSPI